MRQSRQLPQPVLFPDVAMPPSITSYMPTYEH
jgi:hypothetical protein